MLSPLSRTKPKRIYDPNLSSFSFPTCSYLFQQSSTIGSHKNAPFHQIFPSQPPSPFLWTSHHLLLPVLCCMFLCNSLAALCILPSSTYLATLFLFSFAKNLGQESFCSHPRFFHLRYLYKYFPQKSHITYPWKTRLSENNPKTIISGN